VFFVLSFIQRVRRHQIYLLLGLAAAAILAGGLAFAATQRVSLGTGLYWSVTTATTVGYGDVTPHDSAGRIIAVAEMLTVSCSTAACGSWWSPTTSIRTPSRRAPASCPGTRPRRT